MPCSKNCPSVITYDTKKNLTPKTWPEISSNNPGRLIHPDAECWAVIDCVLEAITGHSVVKRRSPSPERLLSLWFYAYSSKFIITHANQGGSSRQAILLCQHLWVATETQQPNYLCTIWQRLRRRPPPLHNPCPPLHCVKQSTSNHWRSVDWAGRHYAEHVWANNTLTINECDPGL